MHQVIQVSKGFAQSKTHLVPIEGSAEQDRQQLHFGLRLAAGGKNFIAACLVMSGEGLNARVQPEEGEIVRRQNERAGWDRCLQLGQ